MFKTVSRRALFTAVSQGALIRSIETGCIWEVFPCSKRRARRFIHLVRREDGQNQTFQVYVPGK